MSERSTSVIVGSGGGLAVRVLPATDRALAGDTWRAVESSTPDVAPFAGWDWTELWLEQFADAVPHEYLVVERDGAPCAAALLTRSVRRYGPLTVRRMHLGTAGEPEGSIFVEYNAICSGEADRADVAQAVLAHAHRRGGWDELHLDGFDPVHAAPLLAAERRFAVVHRESRVLELGTGTADLVDALESKSARSTVRRSLRGISPYTTEWVQDVERAHAVLDELARLHQQRWLARGEPGAFATARFRDFHRAVITRWLPQGRTVVFAVRNGEEIIAALYGFVVGDTLQYYQGGFQVAEHNKVRTGYAAHLLLATEARERGFRYYEYLAGDSRFKSELSTTQRSLVWATLTRSRPRALAIHALRNAARRVQQQRARSGS